MTAHDTPRQGLLPDGWSASIRQALLRVAEWSRRFLIAFAVIMAAGFLAVFTALFGLVLASIAILLRFAGRGADMEARGADVRSGSITLDARRTPRGWTVE